MTFVYLREENGKTAPLNFVLCVNEWSLDLLKAKETRLVLTTPR